VREVLRLLLESWGAVVRTAQSAEEALARVRDFRPQLLLSDLSMPGRDGCELMREVRGLPPELGGGIRAAALTARGGAEDRRRALEAGFEEHLLKPVDPPVLREKLAALLAPRRQG
jgi:CheY-like chemotaxis protein